MKDRTAIFVLFALLVLLMIVSIAFAYYYGTQQSGKNSFTQDAMIRRETEVPEAVADTPNALPSPVSESSPPVPSGWLTHTNGQYGFEISYPPSYQALTDEENLYGWPKAVVLFYDGGQSYDLAIEYWSSQSEYEDKYRNQPNVTVKKVGGFYITLLNTNFLEEVDGIIQTFRTI